MSRWLMAVPGKKKRLIGAKVAKDMLKHQWRPFGIPAIITSDQGSYFTEEWWRAMCAKNWELGRDIHKVTTIRQTGVRKWPGNKLWKDCAKFWLMKIFPGLRHCQ